MTVFARSDVDRYVSSHGHVHDRPVVDGEPVRVFALACPMCEMELSSDPCWSQHPDMIPSTADEERKARKLEVEGTSTMRQVAEALAMSAGKILHERDVAEPQTAATQARFAAAAEAERASAAAERARDERAAALKEATRIAMASVPGQASVAKAASGQDVRDAVPAPGRDVPDFPAEAHPSRKCGTCGNTLTRRAHATGRWPSDCLDCRK